MELKKLLLCTCNACGKDFMVWDDAETKQCPHCQSTSYTVKFEELKGT